MKINQSLTILSKIILAPGLIFLGLSSTLQAAQSSYKLTDLGALTTNGGSAAVDINNHGQIAGYSWTTAQQTSATIWNNGQISLLSASPATSSATAINDAGIVVGYNLANGQNAMVWANGQESKLAGDMSIALDINDQGVIAGATYNDGPVTWTNGNINYLPSITSPYFSFARGINNLGQVVGSFEEVTPDFQIFSKAALWENGNVVDLGTAAGFNSSYAEKINDAGDIVGQSNNWGVGHATLWRDGNIIDLSSLNGGAETSFAKDINSLGQIVGFSQIDPFGAENSARAVIWYDDLTPIALDTLIDPLDPLFGQVTLYTAMGINDLGQIVGYGLINGKERAFLLSPLATVPESETYALMMLGFGLINIVRDDPRRNLVVVLTGGGASLPMAKKLAQGTVTAHGVTIPVAAAIPFPDWLKDDYPDLEDHYTRVAVSLGGARKNTIKSIGVLKSTGITNAGFTLERFPTKGV